MATVFLGLKGMGILLAQFNYVPAAETNSLTAGPDTLVGGDNSGGAPDLFASLLNVVHEDEDTPADPFNILISGKNSSNVDTIIFAQIDPPDQTVHLISIPRDLYHDNRKINSVYADFGMEEMVRRISQITGYPIAEYILVDMYVFKDLVDLIGGIDITLTEDLIDSTYKIIEEDGTETTLNYPAGDYHLNGTEALRIARSRHTTSDYSRAARQQIILEGLRAKAEELGVKDALTVLQIIQTVLANTETNISLEKAVLYYLNYKKFKLNSGYVLSTGNALTMELVPVDYQTSMQVEVCKDQDGANICEMKNAIYTLKPKDGNWDQVKWFFRSVLN